MILVTGGAGLVGSELIKQLTTEGKQVRAIYNHSKIISSKNVEAVQCDILDVVALEEVMHGIDEVYHCAAIVSFVPSDAEKLYKINVEGTENIVNACLYAKVRKLVYVSSVAALGRIREGERINETMQWTEDSSNSKYGHSKYLAELEVWRGVAEGLQAAVVCPSIILGYSNWNSGSTKIFKSVYDGFPWFTIGTSGFVDVEDVAKAMIGLMKSNITNEKFILAAENVTYQYVLNLIAKGFGKKQPSKKVTPILAAITWRLEAIKSWFTKSSPLITKETAKTALTKIEYDNSKLLKALPSFVYKKLEITIAETCKKLQQNLTK